MATILGCILYTATIGNEHGSVKFEYYTVFSITRAAQVLLLTFNWLLTIRRGFRFRFRLQ
jgi:hypothetical protein